MPKTETKGKTSNGDIKTLFLTLPWLTEVAIIVQGDAPLVRPKTVKNNAVGETLIDLGKVKVSLYPPD